MRQSVACHGDHLDLNLTCFKILRKFRPLISVITIDFCAIATGQNGSEESSEVHTKGRITWAPVLFFLVYSFQGYYKSDI